jgi:putative acetyltransferase
MDILVREERPGDHRAVEEVVCRAFGQIAEADLVARVRGGERVLSLVAVVDGEVAGHVMFSPVTIDGRNGPWTGLGPLAADPALQRRGLGARLVAEGLEVRRAAGDEAAFVLGHPSYYPRLGFVPSPPLGLHMEDRSTDPAFMVFKLVPGALQGRAGVVRYLPTFDGV